MGRWSGLRGDLSLSRLLPVEGVASPPSSISVAASQRPTTFLGVWLAASGIVSQAQVLAWESEAAAAERTRSVPESH